jgi:hypothetical protein
MVEAPDAPTVTVPLLLNILAEEVVPTTHESPAVLMVPLPLATTLDPDWPMVIVYMALAIFSRLNNRATAAQKNFTRVTGGI